MAILPIHNYFVFNGEIKPVFEFIPSENEGGIYEVLRVEESIPLFLEDHLSRFYVSAKIAEKQIRYSNSEITNQIQQLIHANNIDSGNILISCKTNLKLFFIAHKYPEEEKYKKGVLCGLLTAERVIPNAKVFQTSVRFQANKLMEENNYFEVILVDRLGKITEGSRSNVFFVKDEQIITPPGKDVLLGITRMKTILLCKKLGLECLETNVWLDDLKNYDAAFITGTSPKLLPIKKIENNDFDPSNNLVQKMIYEYEELISDYKDKFSS